MANLTKSRSQNSTLFFISKKNPYPNPEELKSKIANGEVKAFVFKKVGTT